METMRVPELKKPPPYFPNGREFDPETVTPEIDRLPPLLIEKILKPPWLPSMIREEELGPVMVRVPAEDEVIMAGNGAVKAMVPVTPVLKTISSLAKVALALIMA